MGKKMLFLAIAVFLVSVNAPRSRAEDNANFIDFGNLEKTYPQKLTLVVDKYEESIAFSEYSHWFKIQPYLKNNASRRSEAENTDFCPVDKIICTMTLREKDQLNTEINYQPSIDEPAIKNYLEDLSRKANRDPVDAKFGIENGA